MAVTMTEVKEKRARLWEKMKAFLDDRTTEDGTLSAEDAASYERMETDMKNLGAQIKRMEALEAGRPQATNAPLLTTPNGGREQKAGRASDQYMADFMKGFRNRFTSVSDVLKEGTDADGGYLVPETLDSRLIEALQADNIVRTLATTLTTTGQHKINIAATKPTAAWVEEGGAFTFGDATFKQILLDAHKLHVGVKVTTELLYDNAFNLETYIAQMFGRAMADAEEDAFLNGDGTNKPTGIFAETGGGEEAATLSAAIKSDDVFDLIYGLKRPYRVKASFIMADKTIASLRKLKDGNGNYIWQPSYRDGEPDMLAGYAVHTSAHAPENRIAFGDYSYYNIGDRGVRSFMALNELFAGNGMVGFLMQERVDGKLVLPEAVKILKLNG